MEGWLVFRLERAVEIWAGICARPPFDCDCGIPSNPLDPNEIFYFYDKEAVRFGLPEVMECLFVESRR